MTSKPWLTRVCVLYVCVCVWENDVHHSTITLVVVVVEAGGEGEGREGGHSAAQLLHVDDLQPHVRHQGPNAALRSNQHLTPDPRRGTFHISVSHSLRPQIMRGVMARKKAGRPKLELWIDARRRCAREKCELTAWRAPEVFFSFFFWHVSF